MKSTLFLDLDYTIFPTDTVDKRTIEPFFRDLQVKLYHLYPQKIIEKIINDLWRDSWDVVIKNYHIPKAIFMSSINVLESISLELNIKTYPDYQYVKSLNANVFLVTTGLTSLQQAKIEALNIEDDFKEIIINDRLITKKTKFDIFKALIENYNLDGRHVFVIGDNPNSEIAAGNLLNLKTIQIVRENVIKGNNATYYINSFKEIAHILKQE